MMFYVPVQIFSLISRGSAQSDGANCIARRKPIHTRVCPECRSRLRTILSQAPLITMSPMSLETLTSSYVTRFRFSYVHHFLVLINIYLANFASNASVYASDTMGQIKFHNCFVNTWCKYTSSTLS